MTISPNTITLLGLAGRKGTGKDTAAYHLVLAHGFRQIALADPIRDGLRAMLGLSSDELLDRSIKETAIDWLGVSPRHLMQTLGTEWGRNNVARDVWLRVATRRLEAIANSRQGTPARIVVSDIRFDDEADWIRSHGGRVIHIRRPMACSQHDQHASEAGVTIGLGDHIVRNISTIERLHERLDTLIEGL